MKPFSKIISGSNPAARHRSPLCWRMLAGRDQHLTQGDQAGTIQPQQRDSTPPRRREADDAKPIRAPREMIPPKHPSRMEQRSLDACVRIEGADSIQLVSIAALAGQREVAGIGGAMPAPGNNMLYGEALRGYPRGRQAVLATIPSALSYEAPRFGARPAARHRPGSSILSCASVFRASFCADRPTQPEREVGAHLLTQSDP